LKKIESSCTDRFQGQQSLDCVDIHTTVQYKENFGKKAMERYSFCTDAIQLCMDFIHLHRP